MAERARAKLVRCICHGGLYWWNHAWECASQGFEARRKRDG